MPKTKFQEVVFGLLMTFFMVFAMELYNTSLRLGGMTNAGPVGNAVYGSHLFCHEFLFHGPFGAKNCVLAGNARSG